MLLAADETLERFIETDQKNKHRDKEGRQVTYGELLEKADPKLANMVAPEHLVERQNKARAAVSNVRQVLSNANLDALIVLGDDQNESYLEDCHPAFAIYFGETIRNDNKQHDTYSHLPEWYIKNRAAFFEQDKPRDYPVHSKLAEHLIESPDGRRFRHRSVEVPARGRRRRPRDRLYPSPRDGCRRSRCRSCRCSSTPTTRRTSRGRRAATRLGQAIRKAVESFPGNERVGMLASGGLSHFLVDEDFDRAILKACADKDAEFLKTLPRNKLNRRQFGNPQLGRRRRRGRAPRHDLVRICAGLSHPGRDRHRHELRVLGIRALLSVGPGRVGLERRPG